MIRLSRPEHVDAETLHAEVDALALGPYRIEWHADELVFVFDRTLAGDDAAQLSDVVSRHDGSVAVAKREAELARVAEIKSANEALVASAKAKRLAGQDLSQAELAALVDAVLFPG